MTRALRVVAAALTVATAGLTAAQTQMPTPTTPTNPITPSTSQTASQTIPQGQSTWKSQDGSVVQVTVDATAGTLTGTFTPGFPCGTSATETAAPNPIVGKVTGNAIAWTLSLPACPSVGTWIGHFQTADTEQQQLAMLWTLSVAENPPGVNSTLTGSSLFVRQAAP